MKKNTKIILAVVLILVLIIVACVVLLNTEKSSNDGDSSTTTNNNNPDSPQDYMNGHSQILKNILLDSYYDELILSVTNYNNVLQSWKFQPHPYAFYEDQGIDLTPLKNGQSEAYTMSYVLDEEPNSLYMYTRILMDNTYYQNYLLKYEIIDQEYNDYYLMHNGYREYDYYIQSVFMNNEIAKSRDPEIISSSKVSKTAQENLTESFQKTKLTTTKNCDIFLMDINYSTGEFVVYIIPRLDNNKEMHIDSNIATVQCIGPVIMSNGVYVSPSSLQHIIAQSSQKFEGDIFLTQSPRLNLVLHRDYENEENR